MYLAMAVLELPVNCNSNIESKTLLIVFSVLLAIRHGRIE
jgi:hypothetical protein